MNIQRRSSFKHIFIGAVTGILTMGFTLSASAQAAKESLRPAAKGKEGMVASANPLASLAGQKMLTKGGNAIDAIVAAASALNAVEPYMSGVAGVGYMLFYSAEEDTVRSLVFGGWVPENFQVSSYEPGGRYADGAGHGTMENVGPQVAAVPGNLAGWAKALQDYGTMSLSEVFEPAIRYLEEGIPVTEFDQAMWEVTVDRVKNYPESNAIYLKDGTAPYKKGDTFTNKPLAKTMKRIAEEGIDVFYKGEIAEEIAAAFQRDGGFITKEDLASVPDKVQWVDPVSINYRGYTVYNNPPPGMGIQQLQTLKIMEDFDIEAMGHNSTEYLAHLLEAIRLSRIDTDEYIGDPEFVSVPVEELLSTNYISKQRNRVISNVKERKEMLEKGTSRYMIPNYTDDANDNKYKFSTTSLSAVDKQGNAVVITQSHGGGFGSGYVAGKTGVVFNNAMDWMTTEPDRPNTVAPGKAIGWCIGGMLQLHKDGQPEIIIGSPGSYGILQSVPQVAINVVDFDMTIQEAISAPRFRWKDESLPAKEIIMETRVEEDVRKSLGDLGYILDTSRGDWSMTVGGVQGITIDRKTGWIWGGADARRNGYALGW